MNFKSKILLSILLVFVILSACVTFYIDVIRADFKIESSEPAAE